MIKAHIYNKCIFLLFFVVALTSCNEVFDNSWSSSTEARSLALSNSSLSFTSEAQTKTMEVTSQNIPWSIVNNASWLSFTPNSGTSSVSVSAAVQENKSDTSRVAHTQLRSTDSAFSRTLELMVSQAAPEPVINFSESTIVFDGGSSEKRVSVDSNRSWTYSKSESWISVSRDGNALLISVTANTENGARDGFVTVTAAGKSEQIKITQRSANVTSTISSVTMGNEASSKNIEITSEANWTAECSQSWIDVTTKSGSAGKSTIKISVTDNTSNDVRTGFIYIYVGSTRKLEISVTQDGTVLSVSPLELSFSPDASSQQISLKANTSWNLSCSDSWLHVNKTSGSNDATVTVSVDRNISQQRVGYITLTNKGGQVVSYIVIMQLAQSTTDSDAHLATLPTFASKGGVVDVSHKGYWTSEVISGIDWITLSAVSGSTNQQLLINVAENNSGNQRIGSVRVTCDSEQYYYSVVQNGKSITLSVSSIDFFAKGGESQAINATADKTVSVTSSASWLKVVQNGNTFTLKADKNTTSSQRTATVTVTLTGVTDAPVETITVRQAGVNGTFTGVGFDSDENWN